MAGMLSRPQRERGVQPVEGESDSRSVCIYVCRSRLTQPQYSVLYYHRLCTCIMLIYNDYVEL